MQLAHSPAKILAQLLIDLGVASAPSYSPDGHYNGDPWPVFTSSEPDSPDACLTLKNTEGQDDGRAMIDGDPWYHYGFQLRIRAVDEPTGFAKADALRYSMAKNVYDRVVTIVDKDNPTGVSYAVHCITHIGQILGLGTDAPSTKRSLFTVNAMLVV